MDKAEKTKESWQERRKKVQHKLAVPFIFPEWLCERFSYFLGRWALLDICGHIGRFGVLVSIIVGVCVYVMEADERQMEVENQRQQAVDQRKAKHYQAWQIINTAQGQKSIGGRMDALQDLNRDGISLAGVDISKAYLPELKLENADLYFANLSEAELSDASLTDADLANANLTRAFLPDANLAGASLSHADLIGADLSDANLAGADLGYANLTGAIFSGVNLAGAGLSHANITKAIFSSANLAGADLDYANLTGADLNNIKGWQSIHRIELANIFGVENPPDGFVEWAKEHGAVSVENVEEWKKLISDKKKQEEDNSREDQKKAR